MNLCKSLGQIMVNIQALNKPKQNVLHLIQEKWHEIVDAEQMIYLKPIQYNFAARALVVESSMPPLYIAHLADHIMILSNQFVGDNRVQCVRFVFIR